jgi:hypothetical protein
MKTAGATPITFYSVRTGMGRDQQQLQGGDGGVELLDLVGRDSVPDQAWERRLWQPADLSWGTGTLPL